MNGCSKERRSCSEMSGAPICTLAKMNSARFVIFIIESVALSLNFGSNLSEWLLKSGVSVSYK